MFHFAEINQAPSSYSVQQYIGRVLTPKLAPKNCVRYLETTWEERDWSKNLYEVLSKKIKERGFRKTWHVFSLHSLFLMFGICQMVLCLIRLLVDCFDPKRILNCQSFQRYNRFLSLKVNVLSIQSDFLSMLYCSSANNFHQNFSWNILLKRLEKWTTQMKLFNIPLAACKKILSIYEIPCIHLW